MRKCVAFLAVLALLLNGCGERKTAVESVSMETFGEERNPALQRKLARWYNVNLRSDTPESGFQEAYSGILWQEGGIMGYIEIPSLGLTLPILHDGESGGFVHDAGSDFPIGCRGNHSVLTCGTYLALGAGEEIRIWILGEAQSYTVGQVGESRCILICGGTEYDCGSIGEKIPE